MMPEHKIKVAVSGGGLAGAAIASALSRSQHVQVDIYESAAEFSERGASVGLSVNALRALNRIVPSAADLMKAAGAVEMKSTRIMIAHGPTAGTKVIDIAEQERGQNVHRAALLHQLLTHVPDEAKHASKKLIKVRQQPTDLSAEGYALELSFEDGTRAEADALIGADGIFGFVRSYVLGSDDPATRPVPAGWVDCRNLVKLEAARVKLGATNVQEVRQYGWVGDGGMLMYNVIDKGDVLGCVGCYLKDRDASDDRKSKLDREKLNTAFSAWSDGPIAKGMIDLLLDQDDPAEYAQFEHRDARTYRNGAVCIAGDAAHAMTPWQGSGAAAALEDAVILAALFDQITRPEDVGMALEAYDRMRRPRTQRIAESSRQTGMILCGRASHVGLDPTKMKEALASRWDFIHGLDVEQHRRDAIQLYQEILAQHQ